MLKKGDLFGWLMPHAWSAWSTL